jgi:predicted nucleic acid-binding protein
MIYLTDTSAWEQLRHSEPARQMFAKLNMGCQIAVCTVIVAELLYSTRNSDDFHTQRAMCDTLRVLDIGPDCERRMLDVMQALAMRGQHRSVGIADMLIAATAELRGATVLHHDPSFERIAEVTGQPHEWIVPAGEGHHHGTGTHVRSST